MNKNLKTAEEMHSRVPVDWYYRSIKENIIQRFVHTKRFEEVGRLVEPTGGRVLDIGSADGTFSKVIFEKSKAEEFIGIDVLKKSVDWANEHFKNNSKMKFILGNAEKLKFEDNYFDAVFLLEVLEHVSLPKIVLSEIKRVLKRGGYAIILVPSESFLFKFVWFFWVRSRGRVWKKTHINHFKASSLTGMCSRTGFKVVEDKRIIFGTLHLIKVKKK